MPSGSLGLGRGERGSVATTSKPVRVSRPWPVYALVLMMVTGTVVGLTASGELGYAGVLGVCFDLWLAYSLWAGRRWAFTLMFMLVTLCLAVGAATGIIAVALLQQDLPSGAIWAVVMASALIALLMHPATKRFAGFDRVIDGPGPSS